MRGPRLLNGIRQFVALAILLIAIVARIPNSHCHCHEGPSKQSSTKECPFKQLRQIANTFALTAPDFDIAPSYTSFDQLFETFVSISFERPVSFSARAPPALHSAL
jgi:hypothetical protein